jgi:hypothetical protein
MPKGDSLPSEDHVTRMCGRGMDPDQMIVTGAAFELRPIDKGKLSVDWVECPHVPPEKRNNSGSKERLKPACRESQICAMLNVGDIRQIRHNDIPLNVLEYPTTKNKCHCGIVGLEYGPDGWDTQNDLADLANERGSLSWIYI